LFWGLEKTKQMDAREEAKEKEKKEAKSALVSRLLNNENVLSLLDAVSTSAKQEVEQFIKLHFTTATATTTDAPQQQQQQQTTDDTQESKKEVEKQEQEQEETTATPINKMDIEIDFDSEDEQFSNLNTQIETKQYQIIAADHKLHKACKLKLTETDTDTETTTKENIKAQIRALFQTHFTKV
jgi:hypothetical protein